MCEEELNQVYEIKEKLYHKLHEIVNQESMYLTPEQEDLLRTQLHENFRFWKIQL